LIFAIASYHQQDTCLATVALSATIVVIVVGVVVVIRRYRYFTIQTLSHCLTVPRK
jgi:hypothetical protein